MRIRVRKEGLGHILYFTLTKVEWVNGINSLAQKEPNIESLKIYEHHYPLFDYDDIDLETLKVRFACHADFLRKPIYIYSDKKGSYRVICTDKVEWLYYLHMLYIELSHGLDYQFFRWTIIRGYATLRMTTKSNRKENKIVAIINDVSNITLDGRELHIESYQADSDGIRIELK